MASQEAALIDRVLHARAEGLLRRAVREGLPHGLEPEHLAALAAELDPIACALLVLEGDDVASARIEGTALTVTASGARALACHARRRLLRRPGVVLRPGAQPGEEAVAGASALCRVLGRAAEDRAGSAAAREIADERSA